MAMTTTNRCAARLDPDYLAGADLRCRKLPGHEATHPMHKSKTPNGTLVLWITPVDHHNEEDLARNG